MSECQGHLIGRAKSEGFLEETLDPDIHFSQLPFYLKGLFGILGSEVFEWSNEKAITALKVLTILHNCL